MQERKKLVLHCLQVLMVRHCWEVQRIVEQHCLQEPKIQELKKRVRRCLQGQILELKRAPRKQVRHY